MVNAAGLLIIALFLAEDPDPCRQETRAARWACARLTKLRESTPARRHKTENFLLKLERYNLVDSAPIDGAFGMTMAVVDSASRKTREGIPADGFQPLMGASLQEGGLAGGVQYGREHLWNRPINVRVNGRWSIRNFRKFEFQSELPRVFRNRFFINFRAAQRNYPKKEFYGIGRNSTISDPAIFRLSSTDGSATFGVLPLSSTELGISGGLLTAAATLRNECGFPSVEHACRQQARYRYFEAFINSDMRDQNVDPTSGGYYRLVWTYFDQTGAHGSDFHHYSAEVRRYFPVFDAGRVLALRAMTSLTSAGRNKQIPFFMMGTLGGSESLRGFPNARFRDANFLLLNAEYRWALMTYIHAVVFADAGNVFSAPGRVRLAGLESSYGFGVRLKTPKGPFLRIEYGLSNENRRLHVVFSPSF